MRVYSTPPLRVCALPANQVSAPRPVKCRWSRLRTLPIGGPNWNDRLAVRGFVQGLAEAGVELPSVRRASYVAYRDDPAHLYEGLLAARPAPTMIFCANDRIARSFLRWVHRTGRVVPDDVSIVGTQDMRIEKHLTPPLTTVRFGPENLGRKAVETLLARCREPDREARAVAIPGEWVERASLACAERRRT